MGSEAQLKRRCHSSPLKLQLRQDGDANDGGDKDGGDDAPTDVATEVPAEMLTGASTDAHSSDSAKFPRMKQEVAPEKGASAKAVTNVVKLSKTPTSASDGSLQAALPSALVLALPQAPAGSLQKAGPSKPMKVEKSKASQKPVSSSRRHKKSPQMGERAFEEKLEENPFAAWPQ